MTSFKDLIQEQRYDEVIDAARLQLLRNPEDRDAIEYLIDALRAKGQHLEAIQWMRRHDILRDADEALKAVRGSPGHRSAIAFLYWKSGEYDASIAEMHALVAGVRSGKIKYATDPAGIGYGLLLYYMATAAGKPEETAYALDYLKNRVERLRKYVSGNIDGSWPCPIAQYLLGDISFATVLERLNRGSQRIKLNVPDAAARLALSRRYKLARALFYQGVKSRAEGDETRFLDCMRQCSDLGHPSGAEENLARYELMRAATRIV